MANIIIVASVTGSPQPIRGTIVNLIMNDGTASGPFRVDDVGGGMEEGEWTAVLRAQDGSSKVVNSSEIRSVAPGGEWSETQERQQQQQAYEPVPSQSPSMQDPIAEEAPQVDDVRSSINSIVDRYVEIRGETDQESQNEKFILFERIWNHPYGKSTVGRTLMKASRANQEKSSLSTEDRESDCRVFLENVLKRAERGLPFLGFLSANMRHLRSPNSTWNDRIYPKFLPYMEEFYGRGDSGLIADDIREMGSPNVVIWEAYRRNEWNNYKTEDGKDRIQAAIEKLDRTVNEEIDKEVSSIQDPSQREARAKELRSMLLPITARGKFKSATGFLDGLGVVPTWKNKSSPDWLTTEIIDPARHALGPRQVVKYLSQFDKSRSPDAPEAFEKKAPPLFKEKPKNIFKELSEEIEETIRSSEEIERAPEKDIATMVEKVSPYADDEEDLLVKDRRKEYLKERSKKLRERILNIDPNNLSPDHPDRMRRIMEFIRDEYDPSDPKYEIANAFASIPIPKGKGEQLKQMNRDLTDRLVALMDSTAFKKPRKDETFGLTPAQRFNLYLVEFIQDIKQVIMDDRLWDAMKEQIGSIAHAIRSMIRTAMLFARNMKRS